MLVDAEPTPPFSRHLVPAERVEFSAHSRTELLAQGGQRRGRPGARSREQPIDRAREHDPSPVSSSTHRSGGRYDSSCAGSGRGARSRSIRSSKASPTASHRSPGQIAFRTGGGLQRLPPAGLDVAGTRQAAPQELGQRARRALRLVLDRHARRIPRSTDTPPVSRSCVRARWGAVPTALPRGRGWCVADHSAEWVARPKRNGPLTSLPRARSSRGRYWDRTSDLYRVKVALSH